MKIAMKPKVMVTGCFDLLHSGHIEFLMMQPVLGIYMWGIGSDVYIYRLKGLYPVTTEDERMYILKSLKCISSCFVNSGMGIIDFEKELLELKPDMFIVNEDGHTPRCRRWRIYDIYF